jgi:hypothetical protein
MLQVRILKSFGDFTLDAAFDAPAGITAIFGPSFAHNSAFKSVVFPAPKTPGSNVTGMRKSEVGCGGAKVVLHIILVIT